MDKSTSPERQRGAEMVAGWLTSYCPQSIDPVTWAAVRPFVLGCAERLQLDRPASATRLVRVLVRLAAWALGEGLPLDAEIVLDPETVERFIAIGLAVGRSRATYRAELRRVGPLLTRTAPWEPRPAPVARRLVAVPYTAAQIEGLCVDAEHQPTPARRRAAHALLALGAGAGLDGRWVARVGRR